MPRPKFQKGNKFGNGRPRIPDEVKEIRRLNKELVNETVFKYMAMPLTELKTHLQDPNSSALDHFVMRIIKNGIEKGDQARLESLLNRTIGSVKQIVENVGERPRGTELLDQMHKELVMLIMPKEEPKEVEQIEAKGLIPNAT